MDKRESGGEAGNAGLEVDAEGALEKGAGVGCREAIWDGFVGGGGEKEQK